MDAYTHRAIQIIPVLELRDKETRVAVMMFLNTVAAAAAVLGKLGKRPPLTAVTAVMALLGVTALHTLEAAAAGQEEGRMVLEEQAAAVMAVMERE